ncbi:MAG: DOMON-like domain-containing protein [Burkholderiales bacterium]
MASSQQYSARLTCHPGTRSAAVRSIEARLSRSQNGILAVRYVVSGDLDRVRVPPPRTPRIADRLWQHTCCEIFISKNLPAYHEFNFSPSGEWASYAFERYREGAPLMNDALEPRVTVRRNADTLELDVLIHLARLSPMHSQGPLTLAVSAVVEDDEGGLSYWALAHPTGKPDFHHPDAFALELK